MDDKTDDKMPGGNLGDTPFTGIGGDLLESMEAAADSYKAAAERYVAEKGLDIRTGPVNSDKLPNPPYIGGSDFGWLGSHPIAPILLVRGEGNKGFGICSYIYGATVNPETIADAILELAGSLEFTEHNEHQGPIPVFLEGEKRTEKAKPILERRVEKLRETYKIKS